MTEFIFSQATDCQSRGPRRDLGGYTAKTKIEWRKYRARSYSKSARERVKAQINAFQREVERLRTYRALVEDSPHIILVLSDDIRHKILYANSAITRHLHINVSSVLGKYVLERTYASHSNTHIL